MGEALFYAALLFLGTISLAALAASQILDVGDQPQVSGWRLLLAGLVGLSFVLIGGSGVLYSAMQVGASAERRSAFAKKAIDLELLREAVPSTRDFPNVPRDTNLTNSPGVRLTYRLPLAQPSTWKFVAGAAFWLASIGLASVLVVWAFNGGRVPGMELYRLLVASPFVAIGIAATCYFANLLLVYTSLGPTNVEISDHPLVPGEAYRVFLSQAGRLWLNWLELKLVCEEEATYQQGTDIRTETLPVYEQQLFYRRRFQVNPGIPFEHECALRVPDGAMHSFKSPCNAVYWKLVVRGDAAGWPPFERSFPVIVYPGRPE